MLALAKVHFPTMQLERLYIVVLCKALHVKARLLSVMLSQAWAQFRRFLQSLLRESTYYYALVFLIYYSHKLFNLIVFSNQCLHAQSKCALTHSK